MHASSLNHVTDLAARLRLALKYDELKVQSEEVVIQVFGEWNVCFNARIERDTILFDTLADVPQEVVRTDRPETLIWAKQYRLRPLAFCIQPGATRATLIIDLQGMAKHFDWSEARLAEIMTPAIERLIEEKPNNDLSHRNDDLSVIVRRLFSSEDDLARRAELWALRARMREGRTFELRTYALPTSMPNAVKNGEAEERELNPIIDRLIHLGMTMEEVKAEFMELLEGFIDNGRPQFLLAFAGAKCFGQKDHEGELGKLLRERYRAQAWDSLVKSCGDFWPRMYHKLVQCGMGEGYRRNEEREAFYRPRFLDLMAEGRLTRAWQLALTLQGEVFFSERSEKYLFERARKYIEGLAPEAFAKAYAEGRYGVAAALVMQFGKETFKTFESELADVVEIALDLEQPIRFNDTLTYYLASSWPEY